MISCLLLILVTNLCYFTFQNFLNKFILYHYSLYTYYFVYTYSIFNCCRDYEICQLLAYFSK